ncbi:MAG: hypothetical protein V4710_15285 [Verrucomicrobiota bacterium]
MRIGFLIDHSVPSLAAVLARKAWPHHLLFGWNTHSPMAEMRFGWIAREINRSGAGMRYELYRPWRRYEVVVFVKSMSAECLALAHRLKQQGTKVIFDINVDYFTPASGTFYYEKMAPAAAQREEALAMAHAADALIAASSHLARVCAPLNSRVSWVPDNVRPDLLPARGHVAPSATLSLWWSGEPVKLFELLLIEPVLRKFKHRLHLHLVTHSLAAMDRWTDDLKPRFVAMLAEVPHTIHPFRSVPDLLRLYSGTPGLTISPRFLDNTYNLGHTEWKITLAMACGLPALCSPVPSYRAVLERSRAGAMEVCATLADWEEHLSRALEGKWELDEAGEAARQVVHEHYSTPVVARQHRAVIEACTA